MLKRFTVSATSCLVCRLVLNLGPLILFPHFFSGGCWVFLFSAVETNCLTSFSGLSEDFENGHSRSLVVIPPPAPPPSPFLAFSQRDGISRWPVAAKRRRQAQANKLGGVQSLDTNPLRPPLFAFESQG